MEMSGLIRFAAFMLLIFPIMTLFRSAFYFPHFMCSVCQSMYTSQVPAKFMEWCVHQVIAEAILWFASAELFMFLIIKVIFCSYLSTCSINSLSGYLPLSACHWLILTPCCLKNFSVTRLAPKASSVDGDLIRTAFAAPVMMT